jgi:uncharacterized protein (DUF1015 family)
VAARLRPFRALHFDSRRVAFADVVAPPFDVIGPALREDLAARSPYNVVHLILPDHGEADAHDRLCAWRAEGVLRLDDEPCLYAVEQDYDAPDGVRRTRRGFIGLIGIEPYERHVVLPHERTRLAPIEDRLALLRATRAQLSPVFGVYRDPEGLAEAALAGSRTGAPEIDVVDDDGTRHRLWRAAGDQSAVIGVLAGSTVLIADGHHRYGTALRYAEETGAVADDPAAWALMYLSSADDELSIYPTHRVVSGVATDAIAGIAETLASAGLVVEEVGDAEAALAAAGDVAAFAVLRDGLPALLVASTEPGIDTELCQSALLTPIAGLDPGAVSATDRIRYVHRAADAGALVAPGVVAVLVRAPSIAQVEEAALEGRMMPPKTTYFFPKTVDGFVFYDLADCR